MKLARQDLRREREALQRRIEWNGPALVWSLDDSELGRDAQPLGICTSDEVQLTSRRGTIIVKALVTDRVGQRVLFMPFHFAEAAANMLTNNALDPIAKIPEYKVCAVKVELIR